MIWIRGFGVVVVLVLMVMMMMKVLWSILFFRRAVVIWLRPFASSLSCTHSSPLSVCWDIIISRYYYLNIYTHIGVI